MVPGNPKSSFYRVPFAIFQRVWVGLEAREAPRCHDGAVLFCCLHCNDTVLARRCRRRLRIQVGWLLGATRRKEVPISTYGWVEQHTLRSGQRTLPCWVGVRDWAVYDIEFSICRSVSTGASFRTDQIYHPVWFANKSLLLSNNYICARSRLFTVMGNIIYKFVKNY